MHEEASSCCGGGCEDESGSSGAACCFKKGIGALLFLAALSGCLYFYTQYRKLRNDPAIQAKQQTESALKDLSGLMILPDEPNPGSIYVDDTSKLQDNVFLKRAQVGDVIFLFKSDMKAVMYRPSSHKIVDIAPLVNEPAAGAPAAPESAKPKK